MNDKNRKYWELKFKNKKSVWGNKQSRAAELTVLDLKERKVDLERFTLLDVGCGYGRDLAYFVKNGIKQVMGIDHSKEAIKLAKKLHPQISIVEGDVENYQFVEKYDIIYCNFLLHLFSFKKTKTVLEKLYYILNDMGLLYTIVSSEKDDDYKQGIKIGPDVVKNSRGIVKTFYSDSRINNIYGSLFKVGYILFEEEHDHDNRHKHLNYFIICQKS